MAPGTQAGTSDGTMYETGRILSGEVDDVRAAYAKWAAQPVDLDVRDEGEAFPDKQTTLAKPVAIAGPGTFLGKETRRLVFEPTDQWGWWFDRTDLPESLPIRVSVTNVWTTARNIVLRSGSPHNYMRMVEHIIALNVGMGLDNVLIRMDSGDPPLFERGSLDLVEAAESVGIVPLNESSRVLAVKEPVTVGSPNGGFLTFLPPESESRRLFVDCAVDFKSAIGRQRIRFVVNPSTFRHGAVARTNTTLGMTLYTKTIGKAFADVRNLGYNTRNILIAGRWRYLNQPKLRHEGKSLEAVWHRAALDLLAAVALIDRGRLAGRIVSYKAGHSVDVEMIRELYRRDLLEEV